MNMGQNGTLKGTRLRLDTTFIEAAKAVSDHSRRAFEIAIETTFYAATIDPDHWACALATCLDLDGYGIYDGKIADLFDNVCCGCHVNLKTRLRAHGLGLINEEGFWAPDLSVEHYLKKIQEKLPRFAKGQAIITSKQEKAAEVAPTVPEQYPGCHASVLCPDTGGGAETHSGHAGAPAADAGDSGGCDGGGGGGE